MTTEEEGGKVPAKKGKRSDSLLLLCPVKNRLVELLVPGAAGVEILGKGVSPVKTKQKRKKQRKQQETRDPS